MQCVRSNGRRPVPGSAFVASFVAAVISICLVAACGGGSGAGWVASSTGAGAHQLPPPTDGSHSEPAAFWVSAWSAAPTGPEELAKVAPAEPLMTFENQTLRMIVRSSVQGTQLRLRFSNQTGLSPSPMMLGRVRVALRTSGGAIDAKSSRDVSFAGQHAVTIAPGGTVLSDPVTLDVPALSDLAVSVYLPTKTLVQTLHPVTRQTQYVADGAGDRTDSADLPKVLEAERNFWFLLSGLDVSSGSSQRRTLVAFGDSITDGFGDPGLRVDAPTPWPSWPSRLAERLQSSPDLKDLAVANAAISGNRVLNDAVYPTSVPADQALEAYLAYGRAGVSRFDRDVTSQSGARCVIILEGINDIGMGTLAQQPVSAQQLIEGHRALIGKAKAAGLAAIGATVLPFKGDTTPTYYTEDNDKKRQALNEWIRTGGEYDAVIDFDALMKDAAMPQQMRAEYDSGDHLHPSDAGYKAMADAVDLDMIKRQCLR